VCTAGIIGTTTLAYTFEGVSIVFVMLLMRGGVLLIIAAILVLSIAPALERRSQRHAAAAVSDCG